MDAMYDVIHTALDAADASQSPLTFVVFVPGWTDTPAWGKLQKCEHLRNHFVVAATDHGYCDGAAHQRKNTYRTSVYDTGVFVLQSKRAVETNAGKTVSAEGGKKFEKSLRASMATARTAAVRAETRQALVEKEREIKKAEKAKRTAEMREKRSEAKAKKRERFEGDKGDKDGSDDDEADGKKAKRGERKKESRAAKVRRKRREAAGWTKGRNGGGKKRAPKPADSD
jgi:phosphorylated CTD-interacting factor 1